MTSESSTIHTQKLFQNAYRDTLSEFRRITQAQVFFKVSFLSLFGVELLVFALFFPFFTQSSLIALTLGVMVLSFFVYFVLLFYFQTKRPLQLAELKETFLGLCRKNAIRSAKGEEHLTVAQSLLRLVSHFNDFEYQAYPWLKKMPHWARKFCDFLHREDLFKMKEQLLEAALHEQIEQVKKTPLHLELHASLANAYVVLAKLYEEEKKEREEFLGAFFPRKKEVLFQQKFHFAVQRAIEELQILNDYAPSDPWIHSQLAQCYRTLGMKEQEALEYEIISKLSPQDNEVFFRLGVLYFELGQNGKGLRIFEELRKRNDRKTQELISHYGAIKFSEDLSS